MQYIFSLSRNFRTIKVFVSLGIMRIFCLGKQKFIAAFLKTAPVYFKYFFKKIFQSLKSAWLHGIEVSAELIAQLYIIGAFAGGEHNDLYLFQSIFPASDFLQAVKPALDRHIDIQKNDIRQAVFIIIKCVEKFLPVTRSLDGSRQIQILNSIQKQQSVIFIIVSYKNNFLRIGEFGHL